MAWRTTPGAPQCSGELSRLRHVPRHRHPAVRAGSVRVARPNRRSTRPSWSGRPDRPRTHVRFAVPDPALTRIRRRGEALLLSAQAEVLSTAKTLISLRTTLAPVLMGR